MRGNRASAREGCRGGVSEQEVMQTRGYEAGAGCGERRGGGGEQGVERVHMWVGCVDVSRRRRICPSRQEP